MAALSVTEHVAAPLHAPLHPVKVYPVCGAAVRVTVVPLVKFAEQVEPQLIPEGELVTVPVPEPAGVTVNDSGVLFGGGMVGPGPLDTPWHPPRNKAAKSRAGSTHSFKSKRIQ